MDLLPHHVHRATNLLASRVFRPKSCGQTINTLIVGIRDENLYMCVYVQIDFEMVKMFTNMP